MVPIKNTGGVFVFEVKKDGTFGKLIQISRKKFTWFYHFTFWIDMNGDGRLDCLTARASKAIWGKADGELVWFEHPEKNALRGGWKEHVISKGPDVSFIVDRLTKKDDIIHIISCEFFSKRMMLTEMKIGIPEPKINFRRIIDDKIGDAYHSEIVDIDGDGELEILATNHEEKEDDGAVFIYKIPVDLHNGIFLRRKIASGFKIRGNNPNHEGVPGFAYSLQILNLKLEENMF